MHEKYLKDIKGTRYKFGVCAFILIKSRLRQEQCRILLKLKALYFIAISVDRKKKFIFQKATQTHAVRKTLIGKIFSSQRCN